MFDLHPLNGDSLLLARYERACELSRALTTALIDCGSSPSKTAGCVELMHCVLEGQRLQVTREMLTGVEEDCGFMSLLHNAFPLGEHWIYDYLIYPTKP